MVEQSMISAPLVIAGITSFHTDSTCLPRGQHGDDDVGALHGTTELSAMAAPSALA